MNLWDSISTAVDKQWDSVHASVDHSISDFRDVGLPALIKTGAERGINVLTQMRNDASKDLQNNVQNILQRPSDPDSWFNRILAPDLQAAGLKTYAPYIIGGVAVVLLAGMYLKGAK